MQINGDNIKFNNLDELTSVLGTVSEDGSGNSNGAIFESGENANGSYVKLANGWMICAYAGPQLIGGFETWTYPSPFVATPITVGTAWQSTAPEDRFVVLEERGLLNEIGYARVNGAGAVMTASGVDTCYLISIGKWK